MSDLSHDPPGVQGLIQLGRNAIERVSELERGIAERDERLSSIERTFAVLKARLRACGQLLIEEIGADSPENADVTAERAAKTIRQLRAQLDEYERAPHVDPDWLANVIRRADPRMSMTSDELAEKIAEAINGRAK